MSGNLSNFTSTTTNDVYRYPCLVVCMCFFSTTVLLLPLFALILYVGRQQWRKKSSVGRAMISHSDFFAFNIIPMELFGVLGNGCNVYFMFTKQQISIILSQMLVVISMNGQNVIHLITCVEHYVAVLHPVQYLMSKKPCNIKIRNISFMCFWAALISVSPITVKYINLNLYEIYIIAIFLLGVQFLLVVFCSISILRSLTRPGPGDTHRDTVSVDLKKRRAFYTVTTITGVLLIRFLGSFFQMACLLWMNNNCFIQSFFMWFGMPSSLVQPLLFLHRAGKLPFCKAQRSRGRST